MTGYFVTGTDTGVGKTVAAAALLYRLQQVGPARYWKPVQTGIEEDDDTATVAWLSGCGTSGVLDEGVRLPRPVSPHLAARWSHTRIALESLVALAEHARPAERWVVEGVGGVLVPLNDESLVVDLMRALALPVVVVARTSLGTINHTLLTIEALRARALEVAGVIMTGDQNLENRYAIEQYGRVRVIGDLPMIRPLTPESLQSASAALTLPL